MKTPRYLTLFFDLYCLCRDNLPSSNVSCIIFPVIVLDFLWGKLRNGGDSTVCCLCFADFLLIIDRFIQTLYNAFIYAHINFSCQAFLICNNNFSCSPSYLENSFFDVSFGFGVSLAYINNNIFAVGFGSYGVAPAGYAGAGYGVEGVYYPFSVG